MCHLTEEKRKRRKEVCETYTLSKARAKASLLCQWHVNSVRTWHRSRRCRRSFRIQEKERQGSGIYKDITSQYCITKLLFYSFPSSFCHERLWLMTSHSSLHFTFFVACWWNLNYNFVWILDCGFTVEFFWKACWLFNKVVVYLLNS